jgi:hypothetical protein
MFTTDNGEHWQVLQNCVRTAKEESHVIGAAFRDSIKAKIVDTFVICTKKWSYYDQEGKLAKAPGILLKAKRADAKVASTTVLALSNQTCELSMECDVAPWEEPEDRAASALHWYELAASKREALAEEARADAGESKFVVASSLRVSWLVAQRADPALYALLAKPDQG